MARTVVRIVFEQHGRDQKIPNDQPIKFTYRVAKLVNTVEPQIGSVLREDEVHQIVAEDYAEVTILPYSGK